MMVRSGPLKAGHLIDMQKIPQDQAIINTIYQNQKCRPLAWDAGISSHDQAVILDQAHIKSKQSVMLHAGQLKADQLINLKIILQDQDITGTIYHSPDCRPLAWDANINPYSQAITLDQVHIM